jgi:hypothetical protein
VQVADAPRSAPTDCAAFLYPHLQTDSDTQTELGNV